MILNSFRTRLLLAIFGCAGAAIIAGGLFTYEMVERNLEHEFDHFLSDKLRFHRVSCMQHGTRISFKFPESAWRRLHDPEDPEYFHFRFLDGRDLFRSYSIPDDSPGLPALGMGMEDPEGADCVLPNGRPGRALGVSFTTTEFDHGDTPITLNLVVAHQRGELIEALARLRGLIFTAGTVAALLLLFATMVIVRQLLRPLANLTQQIGEAPIGEEVGEFSLAGAPQELQPVVTRLNAMMERVSRVLENERQFTNNAAHELRNPLAGLRSQVEVALERARDPEQDEETLVKVLEVQRQMEGAVENLLVLARLDSGSYQIETVPIDLRGLMKRAWKPFFEHASERKLKVSWDTGADPIELVSSPRLLEILFGNLFDNASTYTPEGGKILISVSGQNGRLKIGVRNSNPGIRTEAAEELFKRFHRGEETSTGNRQHAGIGLSLCRRIAETIGGSITASADRTDFQVFVTIPRAREEKPKKD